MKISATELRQNLYRILDGILNGGSPVHIVRRGKILTIVAEEGVSKFQRLEDHDVIIGDPEAIVHMDWSKYWKGKTSK